MGVCGFLCLTCSSSFPCRHDLQAISEAEQAQEQRASRTWQCRPRSKQDYCHDYWETKVDVHVSSEAALETFSAHQLQIKWCMMRVLVWPVIIMQGMLLMHVGNLNVQGVSQVS